MYSVNEFLTLQGQTIGFVAADVPIQISSWYLATWAHVFGARFFHHKFPPGVESARQTLKLFRLADLGLKMSTAK